MAIAALGFSALDTALVATTVVSSAATIAGTVAQKRAADEAAATAQSVASYNASLDREQAKQIDLDTKANIAAMRKDAAVYMSRQQTGYVAAGVRADTGSPLAVRVATAGKFALREQQAYQDSLAKQDRLESEAEAGVAYGEAEARRYHLEGVAAIMNGASKLASTAYTAEREGLFGRGGGNRSSDIQPWAGADLEPSYGAVA